MCVSECNNVVYFTSNPTLYNRCELHHPETVIRSSLKDNRRIMNKMNKMLGVVEKVVTILVYSFYEVIRKGCEAKVN